MQTTAIRTVANSLPQNEVILLTLLISKRYIPNTDLLQNLVPAAPARTAQARKRAETVQVSALSVLSAGLSPAPDYFSAGSTWQAFEPSYAHFT